MPGSVEEFFAVESSTTCTDWSGQFPRRVVSTIYNAPELPADATASDWQSASLASQQSPRVEVTFDLIEVRPPEKGDLTSMTDFSPLVRQIKGNLSLPASPVATRDENGKVGRTNWTFDAVAQKWSPAAR